MRRGLLATLMCVSSAGVAGLMAADLFPPSNSVVGAVYPYEVQHGDTLTTLAAQFGVDDRVIAAGNGLEAKDALKPGQILQIDNRHIVPRAGEDIEILINVPQRMLFRFDNGVVAGAYPIAVGRPGWPTPRGAFSVATKEVHPAWDVPPSIQEEMRRQGKPVVTRVPPGPTNPLGDYWLGLTLPNLGIHGTPAPLSIYRAVTHGCMRMKAPDIAALFSQVSTGSRGLLIYRPVLIARTPDGIFLEAHPDIYRRAGNSAVDDVMREARALGIEQEVDWTLVELSLRRQEGIAIAVHKIPALPAPWPPHKAS